MNLTPEVIDKTLKKKGFNPEIIYNSLFLETNLNEKQARMVTKDATRCVVSISGSIMHITAPMIREIVNSVMVKFGFEKERLQYTRIGFPYYDLNKLFEENNKEEINKKILDQIKNEYNNVKNLMKIVEKKREWKDEKQ